MAQPNENSNFISGNEDNENSLFKTIGSIKKSNSPKVKPAVPKWIANATNYSGDIQTNSSNLSELESLIDECLLNNLKQMGIEKLFPVQRRVIPKLIDCLKKKKYFRPQDVCVISPTGSGKTFAYAVPVINYLVNRIVTQIRVLVILPVSDLASQVYKVFQSLCKNTTIRVGLAISSSTRSSESNFYKPNAEGKKNLCMVDILVATPGKLIDLIQNGSDQRFHLKYLEILIIDEADRMMNETQFQWLKSIEFAIYGSNAKFYCTCLASRSVPAANQSYNIHPLCACSIYETSVSNRFLFKILFSATFTNDPEKIDNLSLYNPLLLNVSSTMDHQGSTVLEQKHMTIPENLKELMIIFDQDKKPLILWHLIKNLNYERILCFTNSILNAHRLCQLMKQIPGPVVYELHSKQNIHKRTKILKKFENGLIDVIISTDMTARGMDIKGIDCVVCYDVPRNETAYIHRIGRTARAGKQGTAITLISPDELKHFNIILRRAHKDDSSSSSSKHIERLTVKHSDLKQWMSIYQQALEHLKKDSAIEKKKNLFVKKRELSKSCFKS